MLTVHDPLFWLIAAGMTLPWGLVAWLGVAVARHRERVDDLLWHWKKAKRELRELRERRAFASTAVPNDGNVVAFPRAAQMGGKHRPAPAVVDVPLMGTINGNDRPGVEL